MYSANNFEINVILTLHNPMLAHMATPVHQQDHIPTPPLVCFYRQSPVSTSHNTNTLKKPKPPTSNTEHTLDTVPCITAASISGSTRQRTRPVPPRLPAESRSAREPKATATK